MTSVEGEFHVVLLCGNGTLPRETANPCCFIVRDCWEYHKLDKRGKRGSFNEPIAYSVRVTPMLLQNDNYHFIIIIIAMHFVAELTMDLWLWRSLVTINFHLINWWLPFCE